MRNLFFLSIYIDNLILIHFRPFFFILQYFTTFFNGVFWLKFILSCFIHLPRSILLFSVIYHISLPNFIRVFFCTNSRIALEKLHIEFDLLWWKSTIGTLLFLNHSTQLEISLYAVIIASIIIIIIIINNTNNYYFHYYHE